MKSIMQKENECYLCRKLYGRYVDLPNCGLEVHHVIPGVARRAKSDQYGLMVHLCTRHHREIHSSKGSRMMEALKQEGKEAFIHKYSEEEYIKEFM